MFVIGEVEGCELWVFFFSDDGMVFLDNVVINLKEDICVMLYFSGIIGFFKGVMFIYYNIVL